MVRAAIDSWEERILDGVHTACAADEFLQEALAADRENRFPYGTVELLRQQGVLTASVPAAYGGPKPDASLVGDARVLTSAFRYISRICPSTAQILLNHFHNARRLFVTDNEEVKRFVSKAILEDGVLLSSATSEIQKDVSTIATVARRVDGGFRISGKKAFTTGSMGATYLTVSALPPVDEGRYGRLYLLVATGDPSIEMHKDWDVLGQRGTQSVSITFQDTFVPDRLAVGWVGFEKADTFGTLHGPVFQLGLSAIFQGIAEGAFESALTYIRETTRPWPTSGVANAAEDPYLRWHVGNLAVQADASAHLLDAAVQATLAYDAGGVSRAELSVASAKAKVATTNCALEISNRLFQLCGARATGTKYHLDRYWRNIRTLSLHDPVDYKLNEIGAFLLSGTEPRIWNYS